MAIVRWDPFREMTTLQDQFDRLWRGAAEGRRSESWLPAVDVFDTKDAVVLKAELAGMDPADIQIEVEDNVLTIKGERKFEEKVDGERYYRVERRFGAFQRSPIAAAGADGGTYARPATNQKIFIQVPGLERGQPQALRFGFFKDRLDQVFQAPLRFEAT